MSEQFLKMPVWLAKRTDVSAVAKILWCVLDDRGPESRWTGKDRLLSAVGLSSHHALYRAVRELEKSGLLIVSRGSGRRNKYCAVRPDFTPPLDPSWTSTHPPETRAQRAPETRALSATNRGALRPTLQTSDQISDPPLPSQGEGMGGDDLRDGERQATPRDLLADLPGHAGDAAAFRAAVAGRMRMAGGGVESEYRVPDRGDGRGGRIDLRIEISGETWFVDLDGRTPRAKSVAKLRAAVAAHPGSRGLVVLRDPVAPWERVNDVALIDDAAMNGTDRRTPAQRAVAEAFEEWRAKNGANKE